MGKTTFSEFVRTSVEGKKAAIYVRVSQNEFQRKSKRKPDDGGPDERELEARQSVKTQRSDAIAICEKNKWQYEIYDKDCETSGTLVAGKDTGRKDLARLLEDVEKKRIHTIIARDVKRFARNNRHLKDIIFDFLIPNGVPLVGTSQPLDITTPEGRVFVSMLGEFAELEVYNTRAVSMRNREAKAEEGTLLLNPYTYGFDNQSGKGPLIVVEAEAETVRRIFHMYTKKHMSYMTIANTLNEEGVPTKWKGLITRKRDFTNSLWTETQISKTLRNLRYIGQISYNDNVYESPFPPIVSRELWNETQAEHASRTKKGGFGFTKKSKHLLSGILKCGYCLADYDENTAKGWKITPSMTIGYAGKNGKHKYYICQTKYHIKKDYCTGTRIPVGMIEEFFENFIGGFAADQFDELIANEPETIERLQMEIELRKKKLESVKRRRQNLAKQFAKIDEETDAGILLEADKECKKEIARLEDELYQRENQLSEISHTEARDAFDHLKKWKKLDLQEKRRALKQVIPRIVMYKDRLEFAVVHPDGKLVRVPYEAPSNARKTRQLPKITKEWPFFVDKDGVYFMYGGKVTEDPDVQGVTPYSTVWLKDGADDEEEIVGNIETITPPQEK